MKYDEYREQVAEYRNSGQSQEEWCRLHSISRETLRTWIKRVHQREGSSLPERKSYEEYRELVMECKKSGKTAMDWCGERGILYTTYGTWRKKVHRREGRAVVDKECGIKRGRKPEAKISQNPTLCEIRR